MDVNTRAFARNMFKLRVYESDGQAFEDLFVNIMRKANNKFQAIKPQGSKGDRKNDGYDKTKGIYYQVYAPEDIRKTQANALKKLDDDFKGLKAFWNSFYPVEEFNFVINDKYQGVFADIEVKLLEIKNQYNLRECNIFTANDLEEVLFDLSDEKIISIIGHIPNLDQDDYLFLTGFTYFMGAWIEFEKVNRSIIEKNDVSQRPIVGNRAILKLADENILSPENINLIMTLSRQRNVLVHGDSSEIPLKENIDELVLITEKLKLIRKQKYS